MELIKIETRENQQFVSARELHARLEITERFNAWFERILKYGFVENVDFTGCKVFNTLAKQELDEYILSLDMAKQICMIQRSEIGTKFRLYFIECEKKLKAPMSPLDILKMQVRLMEEQQKQIEEVKEVQSIQSKEIARLENNIRRTQTSNHLTIIAFANMNGIKPNRYTASSLGRKATKLSIEKNLKMGSVVDSRYGNIKTYATEILEEVFYNEGLFNK